VHLVGDLFELYDDARTSIFHPEYGQRRFVRKCSNEPQHCGCYVASRDLLNMNLYYGPCCTFGVQSAAFHDRVLASPQPSQYGVCIQGSDTGTDLFPGIPVFPYKYRGPGSSDGIATDYGLDGPEIESRWGRYFPPFQTGPGAHPASCTMGNGFFPGGKVRPERAVDHSPPSSTEVLEE
jgi:hypothetical protein